MLTKEKWNQMSEELRDNEGFRKPIIVLSKFWMEWIAKKLGVPCREEIDTGCIRYVLQKRIET